jgi:hypothetical protein
MTFLSLLQPKFGCELFVTLVLPYPVPDSSSFFSHLIELLRQAHNERGKSLVFFLLFFRLCISIVF